MEIERGFYYHYKHDPAGSVNNYAYEVMGVAMHTEDRGYGVVYKPLYANTFLNGADFCIRPLDMFKETVTKDGKTFPRFRKIADPAVVAELAKLRDTMYN